MHGVAFAEGAEVPEGLDSFMVEPGHWAVFASEGPHPEVLQKLWAATATDWFPSSPWRLCPGPTLLRYLPSRPVASVFGASTYLTVELAAAAQTESLARNHALRDGNKRTAFILLIVFLRRNGARLTADNDAVFDYILDLAQGKLVCLLP